MSTTLEFFDYIFDRYAYLGVDPASTSDEISTEIRKRRAAIHPDKLLRVSPNILAEANRERDLIDECARMLLSEEMRAMYDEKLAAFKAKEPHLVSDSGVALIDPTRFRVDVDYLLGDEAESTERIEAQARQMSGMDEKRIAKARKRVLADPDDFDARDAFRDELTKKLVFLSTMEDFFWQAAGVNGALANDDHSRAQDGSHFEEKLQEKMAEVKNLAAETIVAREGMAALGMAPRLLLTGPEGSGSESSALCAELAIRAVATLEERAAQLRETVAEKAKTVDELAQHPRWAWVGALRGTPILDIVMITSDADYDEDWPGADFAPGRFLVRIDRATGNATPLIQSPTAEELAHWPNETIALEANPEMPGLFIEAFALANKLANLEQEAEPTPPSPARPAP